MENELVAVKLRLQQLESFQREHVHRQKWHESFTKSEIEKQNSFLSNLTQEQSVHKLIMTGIVDRIDALPLKKELDKLEEKCKLNDGLKVKLEDTNGQLKTLAQLIQNKAKEWEITSRDVKSLELCVKVMTKRIEKEIDNLVSSIFKVKEELKILKNKNDCSVNKCITNTTANTDKAHSKDITNDNAITQNCEDTENLSETSNGAIEPNEDKVVDEEDSQPGDDTTDEFSSVSSGDLELVELSKNKVTTVPDHSNGFSDLEISILEEEIKRLNVIETSPDVDCLSSGSSEIEIMLVEDNQMEKIMTEYLSKNKSSEPTTTSANSASKAFITKENSHGDTDPTEVDKKPAVQGAKDNTHTKKKKSSPVKTLAQSTSTITTCTTSTATISSAVPASSKSLTATSIEFKPSKSANKTSIPSNPSSILSASSKPSSVPSTPSKSVSTNPSKAASISSTQSRSSSISSTTPPLSALFATPPPQASSPLSSASSVLGSPLINVAAQNNQFGVNSGQYAFHGPGTISALQQLQQNQAFSQSIQAYYPQMYGQRSLPNAPRQFVSGGQQYMGQLSASGILPGQSAFIPGGQFIQGVLPSYMSGAGLLPGQMHPMVSAAAGFNPYPAVSHPPLIANNPYGAISTAGHFLPGAVPLAGPPQVQQATPSDDDIIIAIIPPQFKDPGSGNDTQLIESIKVQIPVYYRDGKDKLVATNVTETRLDNKITRITVNISRFYEAAILNKLTVMRLSCDTTCRIHSAIDKQVMTVTFCGVQSQIRQAYLTFHSTLVEEYNRRIAI